MFTNLALAFGLLAAPGGAPAAATPAPAAAAAAFDHSLFDGVLKKYVHDGRVDYAGLKGNADLDKYVESLAKADPDSFADKKAQLAFWINAYNALTMHSILQHYPGIKGVQDVAPDFGFFKQKIHTVGGKQYALNDIENEIVRPRFKDPRVHAALNCASNSCPPLAAFAFTADKLDAQLDAQFKAFARDRKRNAIDAAGGSVKLSQIFNWYGKDFDAAGGVAAFLGKYLEPADAEAVKKASSGFQFLDYDWGLNGK
jgi:hypothetical protein